MIIGCRSSEKGTQAKADLERSLAKAKDAVEIWPLDLSSFESVKEFCTRADTLDRLDVVVENAGVAMVSPEGTLAEGYECTITVNVISTFLMALRLLPVLRKTALKFNTQPRLVIVSSDAHFMVWTSPRHTAFVSCHPQWTTSDPPDQASFQEKEAPRIFDTFKSTTVPPDRYQTSKLLEIFVVRQLAQDMTAPSSVTKGSVILNTVNPGFCRTALFRHNQFPASIFIKFTSSVIGRSAEVGSRVLVYAAAAGPETQGKWIDTNEIREPSAFVRSEEGAGTQVRVYKELMGILEEIEPGITHNI